MTSIDLNCDLGEGFGVYTLGDDAELMPLITSANIACGFHASNPLLMARTVLLAKVHGVSVGAHPSYPDLAGFGRRAMEVRPEELWADLVYQIGALSAFCRAEGIRLAHVKAHGALYNRAAVHRETARVIADAVAASAPEAFMVCLAGSEMAAAAGEKGLRFVEEAFADRAYAPDGTLVPRSREGAVLDDPGLVADRLVRMIRDQRVEAVDGSPVPLRFGTVCVHGDTPGGVAMIRQIRRRLEEEGIVPASFSG